MPDQLTPRLMCANFLQSRDLHFGGQFDSNPRVGFKVYAPQQFSQQFGFHQRIPIPLDCYTLNFPPFHLIFLESEKWEEIFQSMSS